MVLLPMSASGHDDPAVDVVREQQPLELRSMALLTRETAYTAGRIAKSMRSQRGLGNRASLVSRDSGDWHWPGEAPRPRRPSLRTRFSALIDLAPRSIAALGKESNSSFSSSNSLRVHGMMSAVTRASQPRRQARTGSSSSSDVPSGITTSRSQSLVSLARFSARLPNSQTSRGCMTSTTWRVSRSSARLDLVVWLGSMVILEPSVGRRGLGRQAREAEWRVVSGRNDRACRS
jgi:hypothetical protein